MLLVNYLLLLRFAALMHSEDLVMVVLSTVVNRFLRIELVCVVGEPSLIFLKTLPQLCGIYVCST
jgi:hypothetical protein